MGHDVKLRLNTHKCALVKIALLRVFLTLNILRLFICLFMNIVTPESAHEATGIKLEVSVKIDEDNELGGLHKRNHLRTPTQNALHKGLFVRLHEERRFTSICEESAQILSNKVSTF